MKRIAPVMLAVLALVFSSLACSMFGRGASLENVRMAYDEEGAQVTETFAPTDVFYVVADVKNAPTGTVIRAKWSIVDVPEFESPPDIPEQIREINEDLSTGTVYFQLSNDLVWPAGLYRVDIFLNDTLAESLEFNVE